MAILTRVRVAIAIAIACVPGCWSWDDLVANDAVAPGAPPDDGGITLGDARAAPLSLCAVDAGRALCEDFEGSFPIAPWFSRYNFIEHRNGVVVDEADASHALAIAVPLPDGQGIVSYAEAIDVPVSATMRFAFSIRADSAEAGQPFGLVFDLGGAVGGGEYQIALELENGGVRLATKVGTTSSRSDLSLAIPVGEWRRVELKLQVSNGTLDIYVSGLDGGDPASTSKVLGSPEKLVTAAHVLVRVGMFYGESTGKSIVWRGRVDDITATPE